MAIDKKQIDSTVIANYGSFSAWVSAQGATPISIVIAIDIDLDAGEIELPSTIDLYAFVNNAKFANGTLTIGKMSAMPQHRIFSSTMTVHFAYPAIVCPEWWVGSLSEIDPTEAIQKAIDSIQTYYGTVLLMLSTYDIEGPLTDNENINFVDLTDSNLFSTSVLAPSSFAKGFNLSGFISNGNIRFTPEGGIAIRVYNGSGVEIPQGYLCIASSGDQEAVIICDIDEEYCSGFAYDTIANGSYGWLVTGGKGYVYFDADGATLGHYFRIGRSDDGTPVNGQAHSESMSIVDEARKRGRVMQTRSGVGLAMCQYI
jgi:hypothetical protein